MTIDSNRRTLGTWSAPALAVALASALALAFGCARPPSTTPLSAEPPTEAHEGPRSDRRAQNDGAPSASAAAAPAEPEPTSSAAPTPSATQPVEPAAASAASKTADEASSASGTARIELLDAGKEPRQKLRYKYHAGETMKTRVRNEMSMEVKIQGTSVRELLPTMELTGTLETSSVDAQGSARRRSSYSSLRFLIAPGVKPEVQKRMEKQLDGFAGITVRELVSSRGEPLERDVDLSSVKNPELKSTLEGMADSIAQTGATFPEEAVGVGARWRIQRVTKLRELALAHDTMMRLTSLKGNRVEAELTDKSSASAPPATKSEFTIESFDIVTTGQLRMTLDPVGLDSESTSEITTITRMKDTRVTMRVPVKTRVSIAK